MGIEDIKLAGLQHVRFSHIPMAKLMEIADPIPDLYQRLDIAQLSKVLKLGLQYQNKLIGIEMSRLKLEQEAIGEMEKLVATFAR